MSPKPQAYSGCTVETISFETFYELSRRVDVHQLQWPCPFVLPEWLEVWRLNFRSSFPEWEPLLLHIRKSGKTKAAAPFMKKGHAARFIGSPDVMDYQDIITDGEVDAPICEALLDELQRLGIRNIDLDTLRPDAVVLSELVTLAEKKGWHPTVEQTAVSPEIVLPETWDDYLMTCLKSKQRHEVRRKLRRLNEAGEIVYRTVENTKLSEDDIELFFHLFRISRSDKDDFMNEEMNGYFNALIRTAAQHNFLHLSFLEIGSTPAAAVLCFDFKGKRHLYNNGYDPRYNAVSAGLTCKILSIRDAIDRHMAYFDFLKGEEIYKQRLGGNPVSLYRCRLELK